MVPRSRRGVTRERTQRNRRSHRGGNWRAEIELQDEDVRLCLYRALRVEATLSGRRFILYHLLPDGYLAQVGGGVSVAQLACCLPEKYSW